ncbi:4'-phosphopantetheinyl transferase A [Penicillium macrosclerotiorum]|uniref:4'-phosphopantetheinyl transferase A n=1 Tax=Penicillium macrosclerotiorum TaxID=303699 RepID=UPI0025497E95|nr:4'-phosphopantetheinyl transferase A [Penicillium macrosclerotiorum]KAJ5668992.1 4'-phosphopantetheinyl transferase A [Penicillium macrosclerotiorum]
MAANEISLDDVLRSPLKDENCDAIFDGFPTLMRWYIDTREWEANGLDLPMLHALRPAEQQAVTKFHHAADKRMSLASHLLKYLFIHHTCGVPWKDIVFSRTAAPQNRPYYASGSATQVEFNVSHQASLTILAGTLAPNDEMLQKNTAKAISFIPPRLGIDVTCVNERRKPMTTIGDFIEFVSIFSEVFSPGELAIMKNPISTLHQARELGFAKSFPSDDDGTVIEYGLRLFYSYWALKEAYLKMTGDALLAPWVRTLEFSNVIPPDPVDPLQASKPYGVSRDKKHIPQSTKNWGVPYTRVKISRAGRPLDDVRIQLQSFESDYIIATAGSGASVGVIPQNCQKDQPHCPQGEIRLILPDGQTEERRIPLCTRKLIGDMNPWRIPFAITDPWLPMQEVDIELDIRACAEGRCVHPTNNRSVLSAVQVHG